nr:MAG TPA: hypothetical protein [Caudoviricetes sp.]
MSRPRAGRRSCRRRSRGSRRSSRKSLPCRESRGYSASSPIGRASTSTRRFRQRPPRRSAPSSRARREGCKSRSSRSPPMAFRYRVQ